MEGLRTERVVSPEQYDKQSCVEAREGHLTAQRGTKYLAYIAQCDINVSANLVRFGAPKCSEYSFYYDLQFCLIF